MITVFWSIAVYWAWNDIVNDWDQLTANSWNEMIAQIWQNIADIVTNKNDITAVNTSISGINTNVSNLSNTVNNITDNFATDWSLTLQNWWTVNNISSDSTLSAWSSAIPTVDAVKSYIDNNSWGSFPKILYTSPSQNLTQNWVYTFSHNLWLLESDFNLWKYRITMYWKSSYHWNGWVHLPYDWNGWISANFWNNWDATNYSHAFIWENTISIKSPFTFSTWIVQLIQLY